MENRIGVWLLSQNDIINAGCLDFAKIITIAEDSIKDYNSGRIIFPDKVSQIFDDITQNRINCLPATLLEENICGVKWVSVFPTNPSIGLQNVSAVIVLSSTVNGFPLVFMDGTLCSNMRTAAVSAIAAKHFAKDNPQKIGFIGAGQQARFNFMAMKSCFPTIKQCFVSSRTHESELKFVHDLSNLYPDVSFITCGTKHQYAVTDMDIFVSAISGQSPIIKSDWITPGSFYSHIGGWEDAYDVPLMADKIICDDWESVKHRTQTISRLYKKGKIKDEDITCNLPDVISGKYINKKNPDEFVYFNAVGLSYVDISVANHCFQLCRSKNLGEQFFLGTDYIFDKLKNYSKRND